MKKTRMLVIVDSLLLLVVLAIILVKPMRDNVISLFSKKEVKDVQKAREVQDEILGHRLKTLNKTKEIQIALKKAGFYKGEIDGEIGHQTRVGIQSFQKAKGLNPDGIVGPKTWEELKRYLVNEDKLRKGGK